MAFDSLEKQWRLALLLQAAGVVTIGFSKTSAVL